MFCFFGSILFLCSGVNLKIVDFSNIFKHILKINGNKCLLVFFLGGGGGGKGLPPSHLIKSIIALPFVQVDVVVVSGFW